MTRCRVAGLAVQLLVVVAAVVRLSAIDAVPVSAADDQSTLTTAASGQPDLAEFPRYDSAAAFFMRMGLGAKSGSRRIAEARDDPDVPSLLVEQHRPDESLAALQRIIEAHPDRIARAFQIPISLFKDDPTHNYTEPLLSLVRLARARLADLPREQAAATARVLLNAEFQLDGQGSRNRAPVLKAFVDEYAGTDTALLTEVDVILAAPLDLARLDALEAFAAQHPRTVAAAKAVYQKGFDLANNASALRIERPGDDPTARFNQVVEIARRLQSGDFPRCEWVDKAPELVIEFFTYRPVLSPEHVVAMLDVYRDLIHRELPKWAAGLEDGQLDFLITIKMGDLLELRGDRIAGIESIYSELERDAPNPAEVRYARALSYLRYFVEPTPNRPAVVAKAMSALRAVHTEGVQPFARRALATLASAHFFEREYAAARPVYEEYLALYPTSDWAWLARVRLGQCEAALDDVAGAAREYAAAANARQTPPPGRVVALAFSADALAERGQVEDALRDAERALGEWDDDFGQSYRTQASQALPPGGNPFALADDTTITKVSLRDRVAELRASAGKAGGASLERGRRMIARHRPSDAIQVLRRAVAETRGTALESVARSALHHGQLLEALARADVERPDADVTAALGMLQALSSEPLDFHVFAARIASATLLSRRSTATDADRIMTDALVEWLERQPKFGSATAGSIESDVAAIRAEVFRPLGGGVYGATNWNAFEWPGQLPRFLVVNPDLIVKLAGGETMQVTLRQPIAGLDAVIFMNGEELKELTVIITALGGKGRREPTSVMQTPNQPTGPSLDVRAFWNQYFPMRPGHWSGWVFETYPTITDIAFLDAARTRAAVRVTVGYSGGTVMLVKEAGVWHAKELVGRWIT